MDPRLFATVFTTVLIAELGDKTQLATMLYAADADNPKTTVFFASALALVVASAFGVLGGGLLGHLVPARTMRWLAGLGFIAVGIWVLVGGD